MELQGVVGLGDHQIADHHRLSQTMSLDQAFFRFGCQRRRLADQKADLHRRVDAEKLTGESRAYGQPLRWCECQP